MGEPAGWFWRSASCRAFSASRTAWPCSARSTLAAGAMDGAGTTVTLLQVGGGDGELQQGGGGTRQATDKPQRTVLKRCIHTPREALSFAPPKNTPQGGNHSGSKASLRQCSSRQRQAPPKHVFLLGQHAVRLWIQKKTHNACIQMNLPWKGEKGVHFQRSLPSGGTAGFAPGWPGPLPSQAAAVGRCRESCPAGCLWQRWSGMQQIFKFICRYPFDQ